MPAILANDANHAVASDNFALGAPLFYRSSNFHM